MKIYYIRDEKINKDKFKREIGNVVSYIDNSGIYNTEIKINFNHVYPNKISGHQKKNDPSRLNGRYYGFRNISRV